MTAPPMMSAGVTLAIARSRTVLAHHVEVAHTRAARRRGLLRRDGLAPSTALLLTPCFAIHTAFMRFAIDVVFIARDGEVLRIVRDLPPWRLAASPRAHAVIELAAGALAATDLRVGDRIAFGAALSVKFSASAADPREVMPG